METIAVSGATGYVGSHLLAALSAVPSARLVALQRDTSAASSPGWSEVRPFQLLEASTYLPALRGVDCLIHLAAKTGRASAAEMDAVNHLAVVQLAAAAEAAGVRRFLLVSTLAVHSPWLQQYPYAMSKARAEAELVSAKMDIGIVRLGSVFGPRSPVGTLLCRLGQLPVVPFLCDAMQQPVDVEDVGRALAHIVQFPNWNGRVWEVAGPRVASLAACIVGLRAAHGQRSPRFAPLSPEPLLAAFGATPAQWVKPYVGQLAALAGASVADPDLCPVGWQPRIGWADLLRRARLQP